jgi:hypothetical protein
MSDLVYAVVSVYDTAELLPHFLSHYSALGVHRILVVVRSATRGELHDATEAEAARYPASVYWFPATLFSDSDKADVEQRVLQDNAVQLDDYVMHLDLDEFQEYPAPLSVIVSEMNAHNDWALRGWIVDRVAEDGKLAAVLPTPSIGEQYPVACAATERLLNAWTQKIVLCRGRVRLQGGVRHDTENARYDRVPIGTPDEYVVHHFKWLEGLDRRLERRLADGSLSGQYAAECREFLDYFRCHGRIDLSEPRLRARRLGALPIPRVL